MMAAIPYALIAVGVGSLLSAGHLAINFSVITLEPFYSEK